MKRVVLSAGRVVSRAALLAVTAVTPSCMVLGRGGTQAPQPVVVVDGIAYRSVTTIRATDPVRIMTVITATNMKRRATSFEVDSCPTVTRIYTNDHFVGLPVWDSEAYAPPGVEEWCAERTRTFTLQPAAALAVKLAVMDPAVLGAALSDGRYYFVSALRLGTDRILLISGADDLRR